MRLGLAHGKGDMEGGWSDGVWVTERVPSSKGHQVEQDQKLYLFALKNGES